MGFSDVVPPVVGGTVLVIERVQSQNYVPGVSGWAILANGDAEFNDLVARGELLVGPENSQHILIAIDPIFPFRPTISLFTGSTEDFPARIYTTDPASAQLALILEAPSATGSLSTPQLFMASEAALPGQTVLNTGDFAVFASAQVTLDASAIVVTTPVLLDQSWIAPTLAGTWVNGGGFPAGYFKDGTGRVQLRGQVVSGAGTNIFTLPVGYRPTQTMEWVMRAVGGVVMCAISVTAAGVVSVTANAGSAQATGVKLDSISFPTL
jgi:hypothetical protein